MEPPEKPDETDCCNSGCNPCILDVYEEQLVKYKASLDQPSQLDLSEKKKNCMSQTSYSIFKLVDINRVSEDSGYYTFEFIKRYKSADDRKSNFKSDESQDLKDFAVIYTPGQHFLLRGHFGSEDDQFTKAYTPIPYDVTFSSKELDNSQSNPLRFTTLIKLYEGGLMSRYIKKLKINSQTVWRGPYGDFQLQYNKNHIFCVAQGTGIAPIYSVIKAVLDNETCESFIKLFYCCADAEHVYLREELYRMSSFWNFNYEIFLPAQEEFKVKYNEIVHMKKMSSEDLIRLLDDKIGRNLQILICGSEKFSECVLKNCQALGVDTETVHVF